VRLTRPILLGAAAILSVAAGPRAGRAADDPAVAPVIRLYAKFEEALKNGAGDVKGRLDVVGPTLAETFDTPSMVRVAVGPKWKTFTPEQQGAITEAFGTYFVTTYANRLSQAAGGKFAIKPASEARGATRVVHTEVSNKDGDQSEVDYVVGADNKLQDVLLNGNVSEVASMRGSFAEPVKKGGADGLLTFLRDRTAGMLAAKPAP